MHQSWPYAQVSCSHEDGPAGSTVLSSGVVVGVDGVGLSSIVAVGMDGAGRAGAKIDVELRPAKELEYVFEWRPCTSRSMLLA
jgi:hypothetical protein